MKETIYDLRILTTDVINHEKMVSFDPTVVESLPTRLGNMDLVVFAGVGRVYVSTNVLTKLGLDPQFYHMSGHIGRVQLYFLTDAMAMDGLERVAYPSRNGREKWVSERNFDVLAWLENLAKFPKLDTSNVPMPVPAKL